MSFPLRYYPWCLTLAVLQCALEFLLAGINSLIPLDTLWVSMLLIKMIRNKDGSDCNKGCLIQNLYPIVTWKVNPIALYVKVVLEKKYLLS